MPEWVPSYGCIHVCHVCMHAVCVAVRSFVLAYLHVIHVAVCSFVLAFSGQILRNCGIRHRSGWASSKKRNKNVGTVSPWMGMR